MGHQVELCDLSAEMLELARSQIAEKGLEDKIRLIHCPIQDLKQHVTGTFDLVLCHAVLEWLAEPRQTLLGLFPFVNAGAYCRCFSTTVMVCCSRAWWWAILTMCALAFARSARQPLRPPIPSCRSRSMTGLVAGAAHHRQDRGAGDPRLYASQAGSGGEVRQSAGHGAAILPSGAFCLPRSLYPCDGPEAGQLIARGSRRCEPCFRCYRM